MAMRRVEGRIGVDLQYTLHRDRQGSSSLNLAAGGVCKWWAIMKPLEGGPT